MQSVMRSDFDLSRLLTALLAAIAFTLAGWAWQPTPAALGQVQETIPGDGQERQVAAYYFYWYNVDTGAHFVNEDGSDALTDHPPAEYLSSYSFQRVEWHVRELEEMTRAGIDIVLPVYWGDSISKAAWSAEGLHRLVQAEQQMIAEGKTPPKIGLFYDTTALYVESQAVKPDLTTPEGKALFYRMIAEFFQVVPAELRATIDGRPVIVLYTAAWVAKYDQGVFDYAQTAFENEFGVRSYIIREASWRNVATDATYIWGAATQGMQIVGDKASVGPGYDDSAVPDRIPPTYVDRQCGGFYNRAWDAIKSADPSLVLIETWNELHEATEIAATLEYSTTYVDLTARHVAKYKAPQDASSQVAWIDLGQNPSGYGLVKVAVADGATASALLANREALFPSGADQTPSYYIYLNVQDRFIQATPSEVWVTVEYFDAGADRWQLQYDGVGNAYTTVDAQNENSQQWRRKTFHLPDAYFGGRQNEGADLRLADVAWSDRRTNYFGRVWIAKTAPTGEAPNLDLTPVVFYRPGDQIDLPFMASDPDGGGVTVDLDWTEDFVSLTDNGDGTGLLHITPGSSIPAECSYYVRLRAHDNGTPSLYDAVTVFLVPRPPFEVYLPVVTNGSQP